MAPLDPIIQSAGRCNREGKLVEGTLIVVDPADDATPLGLCREATRRTRGLLGLESTSIAADSHSVVIRSIFSTCNALGQDGLPTLGTVQ